jgi:hypothetical protein
MGTVFRYRMASPAFTPNADTYVRAGLFANTNFGHAKQVLVKLGVSPDNTRQIYLNFDIGSATSVRRARLLLYGRAVTSSAVGVQIFVSSIPTTAWSETGVTWTTKPTLGTRLASFIVNDVRASWIEADLTSFIQRERASGHSLVSVALTVADDTSAPVTFDSREAITFQPRLVLEP